MSFVAGSAIKLGIFGSSHGKVVGCTLEGLPSGFYVDENNVQKWLDRRRPGQSELTTQRKEKDVAEIVAGVTDGYTDGGPVTLLIHNQDKISSHYDELKNKPRPGHGDLTLLYKYGEHRNYKGGGFLSGRMTAPLVAAGAITLDLLGKSGMTVTSYIDRIGDVTLEVPERVGSEDAYNFKTRMPSEVSDNSARDLIMSLLSDGDSVGGSIATSVDGVPKGLGEPFFDSVESMVSRMMFSIPGLKAIEFGLGFGFAASRGSAANDTFYYDDGSIKTRSNNNGGITGGITNGMPVQFRIAMKPTSSIRKEQQTVNLESRENDVLTVKGRHDPCIAIRAVPVVQTLTSVVMADLMMQAQKIPRVFD